MGRFLEKINAAITNAHEYDEDEDTIDHPITLNEQEVQEFMNQLRDAGFNNGWLRTRIKLDVLHAGTI